MVELTGFWSYVHHDNEADRGRIIQLSKDIQIEYEAQTGDKLDLFVDRANIKWGEAWREAIDSRLNSVAFFIPVITPRFFQSSECCNELQTFASHAKSVGIKNLVLPILYIHVPNFDDNGENQDELIQLIKSLQWIDWTDLRFKEINSEDYRRGIANIASFLAETNRLAVQQISVDVEEITNCRETSKNDYYGEIDFIRITDVLTRIVPEMVSLIRENLYQMLDIAEWTLKEYDQCPCNRKGDQTKLLVFRKAAEKLSQPTDVFFARANKLASQIHDVDPDVHLLINRNSWSANLDSAKKKSACEFFAELRKFNKSSEALIEACSSFSTVVDNWNKLSRDMRPVMKKFIRAVTIIIESCKVSQDWVNMINSTGIDCSDY